MVNTPHRLATSRGASGKVSNTPSKPFGENWKISRGGSQRNFPSASIPSIRYSPARVIVSINSLGACFSRFALASLAGPLFFKFSKVLIFSLFRGSLGVRSAAGGRRDPRHPKPKPSSFFMRQKAAKSVLAGFSKVGKYNLNELLTKIKNRMKNSN